MRQRYQHGCLRCAKRKAGPDCWEYLWSENDEAGLRVRRTAVIGTVEQYPTRELAQTAVNGLRMQVNEDRLRHPGRNIFVADLVDHYEQTELSEKTGAIGVVGPLIQSLLLRAFPTVLPSPEKQRSRGR